jgi:hypothetical protein
LQKRVSGQRQRTAWVICGPEDGRDVPQNLPLCVDNLPLLLCHSCDPDLSSWSVMGALWRGRVCLSITLARAIIVRFNLYLYTQLQAVIRPRFLIFANKTQLIDLVCRGCRHCVPSSAWVRNERTKELLYV